MANARLVLTDSGGIQEETTILDVPCLTLRENTERPVTVTQGTNMIVGCDPGRIVTEALAILDRKGKARRVPELCPSINSGCCARMDGRQSTF